MKKLFLLLFVLLFISGCGSQTDIQKSEAPTVTEVHNLEVESSVMYSNFVNNYNSFLNTVGEANNEESLRTAQKYADKTKSYGGNASQSFDSLLAKISEVKKQNLDAHQRAYVEKLELAILSYQEGISSSLSAVDAELKYSTYLMHNTLFFDYYSEILTSVDRLPALEEQRNWPTLLDEIQKMEDNLVLAEGEITASRQQIPFKFLSEYERFIDLMKQYAAKAKVIATKERSRTRVTSDEANTATDLLLKAVDVFDVDADGTFWAEGEDKELEVYKRDTIQNLEDASEEARSKADTYYQEAKLMYDQVLRSETDSSKRDGS